MENTQILCEISRKPGDIIMEVHQNSDLQKKIKFNGSPVTITDKREGAFVRTEQQRAYSPRKGIEKFFKKEKFDETYNIGRAQ